MSSTVSVVVCAYTMRRWHDLVAACASLADQDQVPDEVVVVIDHCTELLERARAEPLGVTVVANKGEKGLSDARNTGLDVSHGDVVLFLDDDARADAGWVSHLAWAFNDRTVAGVGAWANPHWDPPGRPGWFPETFLWVVGCSYQGLSLTTEPIRNPIGCAMGFRRRSLEQVGRFSTAMGRVNGHPVGCEETELAIRIAAAIPDARIIHVPAAKVTHRVTSDRIQLRYFLRRCFWEGFSKAHVARTVGSGPALASERTYTTRVLPRAILEGFRDTLTGHGVDGVRRAATIVIGVTITAIGYGYGRARRPIGQVPPQPPHRSLSTPQP